MATELALWIRCGPSVGVPSTLAIDVDTEALGRFFTEDLGACFLDADAPKLCKIGQVRMALHNVKRLDHGRTEELAHLGLAALLELCIGWVDPIAATREWGTPRAHRTSSSSFPKTFGVSTNEPPMNVLM